MSWKYFGEITHLGWVRPAGELMNQTARTSRWTGDYRMPDLAACDADLTSAAPGASSKVTPNWGCKSIDLLCYFSFCELV